MTSLYEIYRWGVLEILPIAPDTAEYETAILIEKFFNVSRTKLLSMGKDIFPDEKDISSFRNGVKTRKSGEPLQYILGQWEFYGLAFKVGRGVLVPRADTETLVDEGLEYLNKLLKENPTKKLKGDLPKEENATKLLSCKRKRTIMQTQVCYHANLLATRCARMIVTP